MVDQLNQQQVDAKASEYLRSLFDKAIGGDVEAGGELSKIALGGFQPARDLVREMDTKLSGKNKPAPVILEK